MRRRIAALGLALALAASAGAAPASAAPILEEEDAAELANALAEATARQNVCYGWSFEVDDQTGVFSGSEVGSNLGPGRPVDPARPECARYVVLSGGILYTSELSESEDQASWQIQSNLPDAPTIRQLEALGYTSGALLGDRDDLTILNATGALPELVAEQGAVEPVPFETSRREPGVGGEPTGDQGSDFLRQNGSVLAVCVLLLLGGLAWLWRLRRSGEGASPRPRPAEN